MSKEILSKLRQAKEEVIRLEKLYRETCECNERLSEVENPTINSYQKTHRTCNYHETKVAHYADI